jgi:hypothetical protein
MDAKRKDPQDIEELAQDCYLAVKRVADAETKLSDEDWIDLDPSRQAAVDEWQEAKDEACAAIMQVVRTLGLIGDLVGPIQEELVKAERDLHGSVLGNLSGGGETVHRTVAPFDVSGSAD